MRSAILWMIAVFLSLSVLAEEEQPRSIDDLQYEKFLLDGNLWEMIEKASDRKAIQCMKAFPNERFCGCLVSQIPMILTMVQYTAIVTRTREEIGYDKMSDEEKKAIDVTIEAREKCAAKGM